MKRNHDMNKQKKEWIKQFLTIVAREIVHMKDKMKFAMLHRIGCLETCVSRTNEGKKKKYIHIK